VSNSFKLPDSVLKQLNEFSRGGYILIRANPEGNPEVCVQFDDAITAIGLIRYTQMWSTAVDLENENNIIKGIESDNDSEDEE
jgi:hypothetical protein